MGKPECFHRRSEESAQKRAEENAVIAEIGRIMSSNLRIEEVYDGFAREAAKLIPFDWIAVDLIHPRTGLARTAYVSGRDEEGRIKKDIFPLPGSIYDELRRTRSGLGIHPASMEEAAGLFPSLAGAFQAGLRSILAVPLIHEDQVIGVLHFQSRLPKRYPSPSLRLAERVAAQIAGAIAGAQLFAEHRRIEEALKESEERYRTLVETSPDAIVLLDLKLKIIMANRQAPGLFGCQDTKELAGRNVLDFITPEDRPRLLKDMLEWFNTGTPRNFEYTAMNREGLPFPIELRILVIKDEEGQSRGVMGVVRDITERRRAEDQVRASLKEKEILLKEIHHRVKNNLQVISSLLKLQSRYVQDEEAHKIFRESQNRIRSMALIHEKLYRSKNLDEIDFAGYIQDLAANLYRSYGVSPAAIALRVQVEEVFLEIDAAIPCGLIINELVSNALKHAFPDRPEGEVGIDFRLGDGGYILRITDNGRGLPPDLDFHHTKSLGLQLVMTLVEQLEGTIELGRGRGTEFEIRFPPGRQRR